MMCNCLSIPNRAVPRAYNATSRAGRWRKYYANNVRVTPVHFYAIASSGNGSQ